MSSDGASTGGTRAGATSAGASRAGTDVEIACAGEGTVHAQVFEPAGRPVGTVIIAPATGVRASYYGRYGAFLAENGLRAITFDYRGVGRSSPTRSADLRRVRVRWHEWGTQDLDAVIRWATRRHDAPQRLAVVGHSFGGVAAFLAPSAHVVDRMLLVGAQHAHWRDYAPGQRWTMLWRWHVVMPVATGICGYFPGKSLGWLENLPRGVAFDWARGRARFAQTIGHGEAVLARAARLTCPVLAVTTTDDPFATRRATDRTLAYLPGVRARRCVIDPREVGVEHIGHVGLFHDRFRDSLWPASLRWLTGHDPTG